VSIKPSLAFDYAWETYQAVYENSQGIPLVDPTKAASDHVWRPDGGPRAAEYIADFTICCNRALEGPEWASRKILCRLYYLALTPYEQARHFMGIREDVWVKWTEEIRDRAGKQVMMRGLFPARAYFGERTRPRRAAQIVSGNIHVAFSGTLQK